MSPLRVILYMLLLAVSWLPDSSLAREIWQGVDRIVAIGDLHGDYEQYIQVLKDNDLLDEDLHWNGGKTHLVQLGDIPDRGPDSLKIIRHLKGLQKQARKSRGWVHALLGNHEIMNIKDDLRYVHPGEYEVLIGRKSKRRQADYLERVFNFMLSQDPGLIDQKAQTMQDLGSRFPLGFVEHRLMWRAGGEVFDWARKNNAVIKINRTLFSHGGISPHQDLIELKEINKRIRRSINKKIPVADEPLIGENGPLWYRGLAQSNTDVELEPLKKLLAYYDADSIVIAHTPTSGAVMPRFDGRVIQVDVGLGLAYGKRRANLVIEGTNRYTVHRGHRIALPHKQTGLLDYLITLSRFDPPPSPLRATIKRLESGGKIGIQELVE